tara:strand:- start:57395 stop:58408 length:1014 start_codon:yes stop_codon:yes gene_type:complete
MRRMDLYLCFRQLSLIFLVLYCSSALFTSTIQFWPATAQWAPIWYLLLFLPKWWAAALCVISTPALYFWPKRALLALLLCGSSQWLLYTGWRVHFERHERDVDTLRIVTLNAGERLIDLAQLSAFVNQNAVDLIAFQELAQDADLKQIFGQSEWFILRRGKLAVASRYPLGFETALRRSDITEGEVYGLVYMIFDVKLPHRSIRCMNVHLETPRSGLEPFLKRDFDLQKLRNNFRRRYHEASITANHARDLEVSIILGDLNMPYESPLYQLYFDEYVNAFTQAGNGLGATKYTRWHSLRIDHVLHTSLCESLRASVGDDLGSDHRPFLVDLHFIDRH